MKMIRKASGHITLDELLQKALFSKKDIHIMKMEKRIIVNGNTIRQNIELDKGDIVEINPIKDEDCMVIAANYDLNILYEDDICLVVEKPVGTIIHDDGTKTVTLDNYVAGYYQKTGQKHPIYHIHRLDKDTSGCVLYCKQSLLVSYFDSCLADKKVSRIYKAKVTGKIEKNMTIDKKIGKDRHLNNKYRVSQTGKQAITHIKPIKSLAKGTLVQCSLETGRTHQIRVHLSSIGHPIIGDQLYGGGEKERMYLHASILKFIHPITLREVVVQCASNWE